MGEVCGYCSCSCIIRRSRVTWREEGGEQEGEAVGEVCGNRGGACGAVLVLVLGGRGQGRVVRAARWHMTTYPLVHHTPSYGTTYPLVHHTPGYGTTYPPGAPYTWLRNHQHPGKSSSPKQGVSHHGNSHHFLPPPPHPPTHLSDYGGCRYAHALGITLDHCVGLDRKGRGQPGGEGGWEGGGMSPENLACRAEVSQGV